MTFNNTTTPAEVRLAELPSSRHLPRSDLPSKPLKESKLRPKAPQCKTGESILKMDDAIRVTSALLLSELQDLQQQPSLQTIQDFPAFSRLPLELRRIIWHLVLPESRQIWMEDNIELDAKKGTRQLPPTPIGSRVNQESRRETLRYYRMLYLPRILDHTGTSPETRLVQCFFDMKADVLVLEGATLFGFGLPDGWTRYIFEKNSQALSLIKNIQINVEWPSIHYLSTVRLLKRYATELMRNLIGIDKIILRFSDQAINRRFLSLSGTSSLELWKECRDAFEELCQSLGSQPIRVITVNQDGYKFSEA
ncbi:hypothetical protein VTL71DRAFT_15797 [Oculimacula yallundae]|uniref:2EXR domain-containing protein n=1 Tax=Oculimacula yallundae TaxID=86028 RepID=A0ABR4CE22_9HELO